MKIMKKRNSKNVSISQCLLRVSFQPMILLMLSCLLITTHNQCPQSCQTCSTSLNCTSCISQNSLLIISGTLGCLPCPIRCQRCTSQTTQAECVTCSQGYYLDPYAQSCTRCRAANCLQCNQYFPSQCQLCQATYFLQESTSSCKYCATEYTWAKMCKQNFILACQDGHFTTNGQVCLKCDTTGGCRSCVSTTVCSQCFQGFYLLSGRCLQCDSSCRTCNTNTSCTSCPRGFRINTSSKCQACSTSNCAACSIQDVCQECNSSYYLESSSRTCILLDQVKTVKQCLRYASNFNNTITSVWPASATLCRICANGTYINLETNRCQGCSLLCETCTGMFRSSKCSACNQIYGRLVDSVNGICTTKVFTSAGEKVVYGNSRNDGGVYVRSGKKATMEEGLLKCPGGQVASEVGLNLSNVVGYEYTVVVKMLIQTVSPPPYNVQVLLNQKSIKLQPISTYTECNNIKIANFSVSFSALSVTSLNSSFPIFSTQPNQLTFKSVKPQEVLIDVRQIVVLVKQCHQSCALCSSYKSCIECKNAAQYMQQQKCVDSCSSGRFLYKAKLSCLHECPKQTFPNINSAIWTCEICHHSCASCLSVAACTSCLSGYYLFEAQCITTCPDTYFANALFAKCQPCTTPCDSCISTRQCLSCQTGFLFQANRTCLPDCPHGYFGHFPTMQCKPCHQPCSICKSETVCLGCTALSKLSYFAFQCLPACPPQYFAVQNELAESSCEYCAFPCQECIERPSKCTQCITGFLLSSNNTCIPSCPLNYFNSITFATCIPCEHPCQNCINSQKSCSSCANGYLLMGRQCVTDCGDGYYKASDTECRTCRDECVLCAGRDNCTSCREEYYLQGGGCVGECREGYFKSVDSNGERVCGKCSENCKACFAQGDYCLDCHMNYFLQSEHTCSSACGVKELSPGCLPCDSPCYSCSLSTTNCTSCVQSYFFSQKTHQCVTECYFGFHKTLEKAFGYCRPCTLPCTNCQSPSVCYSCTTLNGTAYYLQVQSADKKVCVTDCTLYEYKDHQKLVCLKCVEPCMTCANATYCLSCVNGILVNGTCGSRLDGCPIGSYPIQSHQPINNSLTTTLITCRSCPPKCASCSSQTICTACQKNFYLYGESCLDHCPSGSTPIRQLRKCIFCEYPCAQCQGTSSNCTKCSQLLLNSSLVVCPQNRKLGILCIKHYIMKGQCLTECLSTSYPKGDQCVACAKPCQTCISETTCTSCVDGFYILENGCYAQCPDQYYADPLTQQCQKCLYPCKQCLNQRECLSCREGYLFDRQCLIKETCPLGFFQTFTAQQNKYCEKCHSDCLACSESSDYCDECGTKASHEGKCYDKCPFGYFSSSQLSSFSIGINVKICAKCATECLTCTSLSVCESCVFSYSLLGGSCVKRCPPNYMEKFAKFEYSSSLNYTVSECVECRAPCSSCFMEQGLCQSCISGFYMYEQGCVISCPQGSYLNMASKSCRECPVPCERCVQNSREISCLQCSHGFYVSQGVCVEKCNEGFIDYEGKRCVGDCGGGYVVRQIVTGVEFCARECELPYVRDERRKMCVIECGDGEYISASYECVAYAQDMEGLVPVLRGHLFVDQRGMLILYLEVSRDVEYTDSQPIEENIEIVLANYEANPFAQRSLQLSASTSGPTSSSSNTINFSLIHQSSSTMIFSLQPQSSLYYPSSVTLRFRSNSHLYIVDRISKMPLQSNYSQIHLQQSQFYEVYDYALIDKNNFAYVGEIIMDFVLLLGLVIAIFNQFAKLHHFLIFAQTVFMLACLNIPMPPNLYRFLQGFKYAHFYQIPNWFSTIHSTSRYTDFYHRNFNRVESIFTDLAFIHIAGHLIALYSILVALGLALYAVRYLPESRNEYLKKLMGLMGEKLKHVKWSHLSDVFLSTFMLVLAAFLFQTIDYSTSKTEQSVSIALSYIITLTVSTFCIMYLYKIHTLSLQSETDPQAFVQHLHREEYASFYDGITSTHQSYKNYMLVGKVVTWGCLAGLFYNWPNLCLAIFIVIEVVYGLVYLRFMPFADDVQNYLYGLCSFIYALGMILLVVVNQCHKPESQFFVPDSQQQQKILIGYIIIVLILICTFLLIIQMVVSIIRGSFKPKKLEGQNQDYNQVRANSPNSLQINTPGPKKIQFQHKRQFLAYQIDKFSTRSPKRETSIKDE